MCAGFLGCVDGRNAAPVRAAAFPGQRWTCLRLSAIIRGGDTRCGIVERRKQRGNVSRAAKLPPQKDTARLESDAADRHNSVYSPI